MSAAGPTTYRVPLTISIAPMAVLELYGATKSTNTWRVAIVLHEVQVPFAFIPVDIYGGGDNQASEYLEKQPFGQVPYIDDDGFILYESRAICRYIAAKHPHPNLELIPTDPIKNALFEQAASVEYANFDSLASPIIREVWRKQIVGLEVIREAVKPQIAALESKLDIYETILSKQRYLAGEKLTLVDLFHLPRAPILENHAGTNIMTRRPHVSRWFKELISRPSWIAFEDGVKSVLEY
ncbi:glutathione S-transferase [Favolaschia claudopus]|uniref:glutathione transferase n=1 Tax=Favolaschia claudopus TaxID=2862362 RepID=A0AAW0EGM3_9AGAR